MALADLRLWQIDLALLERLGDHLSVILLNIERYICTLISSFLLSRFKSIFYAVYLASFSLALSDHLRSDLVLIDKLLAASGFIRGLHRLIVAHC